MKQFMHTRNVSTPKRVCRSTADAEPPTAEVREGGTECKTAQVTAETQAGMSYSSKDIAVVPYKVNVTRQLLPSDCEKRHYSGWRVLSSRGITPCTQQYAV
jgi:hypothetical protein